MNKFIKILLISSVTFSLFSGPNEDLLDAAIAGDSAGVEAAIAAGANIDAVDDIGNTALIVAVIFGHIDAVRLFLDRGSDINHVADNGWTSLIWAARYGRRDILRLLLDRGANINATGSFGNTVLMVAQRMGRTGIVKILEETLKIKQLVDNAIQGDSSSHQELIEKLKDLNINSYEFKLILNQLINKIKTNKINKFSLLLLLDLAQHIALYLQSLGPDVIELPYEMLELILRDILPNTDFNFQFLMTQDESGKPVTENLIGLIKAFRFSQKVAAFRTRLKLEKPAIQTRKEKQSCQLM